MATRRALNQQKLALAESLRARCLAGQLMPGQVAPSLRQLGEEFGISTRVANQVLQQLIDEGLFHMVPRVGTFVGRPRAKGAEFYLMLLPDDAGVSSFERLMQSQHGFEERIAERGGATLVMPFDKAFLALEQGELPPLSGLFDLAPRGESAPRFGAGVARVGFSGRIAAGEFCDEISYDNEGGGRLAAAHLIGLGHRQIAFLALHSRHDEAGELVWSREREAGWRQAVQAAGLPAEMLAFHPQGAPQNAPQDVPPNAREQQTRVGRELGAAILRDGATTAIVAANDYAATGFLQAARESGLPRERFPSVVGFDDLPTVNGHIVTSLRLPAQQLGRGAADLLWERHHGQLGATPVHRRVAMRLIPRLTSRRDWSHAPGSTRLATAH